jgi:hypothetical protein
VPHSSQLYRDEWAAKPRRPLRLDFNRSSNSGGIVVKAAPSVQLRRCDKSPFDWISMDTTDHLGPSCFATDVRVKITGLSELLPSAPQLAGSNLLKGLEKQRHEDRRPPATLA